jgi:hypothetical protein
MCHLCRSCLAAVQSQMLYIHWERTLQHEFGLLLAGWRGSVCHWDRDTCSLQDYFGVCVLVCSKSMRTGTHLVWHKHVQTFSVVCMQHAAQSM